ncbi:MAG TPA: sialidase family protein, partial [Polyangia bacterium]|nr:sialidase family protein [Polyangia bacterium]
NGVDATPPAVMVERAPGGGIQPRVAVDDRGTVHLVYFRGEASHGDVFYVRSTDAGATFSDPVRVNREGGSAIATGSVRGPQIAVGGGGRVHVAWNGSRASGPQSTPMFYTRSDDGGAGFEPERSVMHAGYNLDGGGAVAADRSGHVYVVWHANAPGERDEARRRVWIAGSADDGRSFEPERSVFDEPTGACGCCGLGAFASAAGPVYVLFRSATEVWNRDIYLLASRDRAAHFNGTRIDRWKAAACMMSTQAFAEGPSAVYAAWETEGQIFFGRVDPHTARIASVVAAPGSNRSRKHPALAVNAGGDVLLAWTEETAWNKGGSAAWQLFDAAGAPIGEGGRRDGVPVWGLIGAYARPNSGFTIVY